MRAAGFLSLAAVCLSLACLAEAARSNDNDESFDMLVLALTWPTTNCMEWKEKNSRNTCYIRNGKPHICLLETCFIC